MTSLFSDHSLQKWNYSVIATCLSIDEVAEKLNLPVSEVTRLVAKKAIISLETPILGLPPHQFEGDVWKSLHKIIEVYTNEGKTDMWGVTDFLYTGNDDFLYGLTPSEILTGIELSSNKSADPAINEGRMILMSMPIEERIGVLEDAARYTLNYDGVNL